MRIDGVLYECRVPDEFGIEDHARLQQDYNAIIKLGMKPDEEWQPGEAELMTRMLRNFIRIITVGLPEDVLARMNDRHCLTLAQAFFQAVGLQPEAETEPLPTATATANRATRRRKTTTKLIGEKSYRDSRNSTAATPIAG